MTRLPVPLVACATLLLLVLALPVAAALVRLLGGGAAGPPELPGLAGATIVSIGSATIATVLAAIGGVPLGYVLARRRGRTVAALNTVVQLPLALPPLASGILLLFALADLGVLGRWTDSVGAIVLAELFVAAPFTVIAARSAFAALDPAIEDAARTLGLGPGAVFGRIALPAQARPIAAGLALTWLRGFGEFGATAMVAYHPYSLPVFTYVAFGAGGLPAMLPVLVPTLAASVAIAALASVLAHERPAPTVAERAAAPDAMPEPTPAPAVAPGVGVGAGAVSRAEAGRLLIAARASHGAFRLSIDWTTSTRRLAILGGSGSGKSLTLRLLAGLVPDAATTIMLGERRLDGTAPERRRIGYVPQEHGLAPHLSVRQQLHLAPDHDPARIGRLLDRLELRPLLDRKPHALSRGQRARVALARALARRHADLLLLDEPFSALDAPLRRTAQDLLRELQADATVLTILVTHDPEEAQRLADELLLLDDGRVLQSGATDQVWRRPVNARAAFLLGARTASHGTVRADGATIAIGDDVVLPVGGGLPAPGTPVGWSVAPGAARSGDDGPLPARLLSTGPVVNGEPVLRVAIGNTVLDATGTPERATSVRIPPAAVQVWPV